jgi:ATP-dependent DNA helicase DinG
MQNYLCMDKFTELESEGVVADWFDEIQQWVNRTETGDKSELLVEYEPDIWRRVSSSSDECSKNECPFYQKCFALAGRNVGTAGLIITNYHMLFTDVLIKEATMHLGGILPKYDVLIMDEAHEAADIAMSFQGYELTYARLKRLSSRLTNVGARTIASVILNTGKKFFLSLDKNWTWDILERPLKSKESIALIDALAVALDYVEKEYKSLHEDLKESPPSSDEEYENQRRKLRKLRTLATGITNYQSELTAACVGVNYDDSKDDYRLPPGMVYFMERDNFKNVKLSCKAVDVDTFFQKFFFTNPTNMNPTSVIAVSATLATSGEFDFIAEGFGLGPGTYRDCLVDSPFDPSRMLLIVPRNVPIPKKQEEHRLAVARTIEKVSKDIGGKTMALFTSYKSLNMSYNYLRTRLRGIEILVQGKLPKSRIIEKFKSNDRSIILATASFWQGVDIPGQALSCLLIDKFPFMPPSDPVLKYLERAMEENGRSAFFEYSVPKAVIALKQGIGRLIRRETDYGVVVLCDNRIDTTGYGKSNFASAFPDGTCRSEDDDLDDVASFLEWMASNG